MRDRGDIEEFGCLLTFLIVLAAAVFIIAVVAGWTPPGD